MSREYIDSLDVFLSEPDVAERPGGVDTVMWVGLEADPLKEIFPILFVADDGAGKDAAIKKIENHIMNSQNHSISIPCSFDGDRPNLGKQRIKYLYLFVSPETTDGVNGRSSADAQSLAINMYRDYEDGENPIYKTLNRVNPVENYFPIIFNIEKFTQPESIRIPCYTEDPSDSDYPAGMDSLALPCFIITSSNTGRKGRGYYDTRCRTYVLPQ